MATVGHANEEALKRKERLKALRQKQAAKCDEGPENKRLATEDDLDSVPRLELFGYSRYQLPMSRVRKPHRLRLNIA